jgi:predicted nuclease of predicted toxin-antitoxin system
MSLEGDVKMLAHFTPLSSTLKEMTSPRARFYADENIGRELVDYIRGQGFRVEYAPELGLSPRDDSFHLQEATRRKCILLSNDADFLDHRRFPFDRLKNTAIVVIRTEPKSEVPANYGYALLCLLKEVAPSGRRNLYGLKIEIRGPRMIFYAHVDGEIRQDEVDISKPMPERELFQGSKE